MADPASDNNDKVTSLPERKERKGLKKGVFLLPNLITTGALFAAFYAIIAAMGGSIREACIGIVIAGFLDAIDGRVARLTNTQSAFGMQYDSMSDLVAFGVAPAVLLYVWALSYLGELGWIIAFLYLVCAAMRLARFNTAPDSTVFYGLASPACAGTMATMVWTWVKYFEPVSSIGVSALAGVVVATVALLMVSNIRYYSPKNIKSRVPFRYMLAAVFGFIVVVINPPVMLLTLGVVYILSGPIHLLLRTARNQTTEPDV